MAEADRLRAQYEEAERLVREAQEAAERAAAREVPPMAFDLAQLTALVESLRGVLPPDLARQLADALRQLLLAIRAVLDWYIARLEPPERPDDDVQDIPVE